MGNCPSDLFCEIYIIFIYLFAGIFTEQIAYTSVGIGIN